MLLFSSGTASKYDTVAEVINRALQSKAEDGRTQLPAHSLTDANRHPQKHGALLAADLILPGPPPEIIKLSNEPFFVEKVRDIVGLYLNPPDKAAVLCIDEKTADPGSPSHPQELLRMGLGYFKAIPMTTSATEQRPFLPAWAWPPAQ